MAEVSGLTREAARERLLAEVLVESRESAAQEAQRVIAQAQSEAADAVQRMMVAVMERDSRAPGWERTTTSVPLPSEEYKARIIGRDGRNVRAFEAITGVDVLLDEVPGHVVLSCFDPQRRAVARRTLEHLLADGRIQPTRIEEYFKQSETALAEEALRRTQQAVGELGIRALPEPVLAALSRLEFRMSYTQNVFLHSVETAQLAGRLGAELGLPLEERQEFVVAALLHDIGKALGTEYGASHARAGGELLRRNDFSPNIVNAVAAHHGEVRDESLLAPLVRIVDGLSGGRPGARRRDVEAHIARLEEMERLAGEFPGVERAYVFQAGRELSVIVRSGEVSDAQSVLLAQEIARRIERELRAGIPVRVSVVRETRATEFARWDHQDTAEDATTRAPE